MKIFFLIGSLYRAAGTERIATDVANALYKATKWDIKFIVLSENTNSFYKLEGIPIISINGNIHSPLRTIHKLRQYLHQDRPDYIINVAIPMSCFSIPATIGFTCKIINWEHFHLYERAFKWYIPRLTAAIFSHKTIVLTQKDKMSYPRFIRRKIQTIYNFSSIKGKPASLNNKIAISIGRLTDQKGFDLLIKAWEIVAFHNKEWKLYIIGSGENEKALKEQVNKAKLNKYIYFYPATPNITPFYQQASLYIMSSRFEGLPLVLIEAKQYGLPCISFICPNGPDEIIQNHKDGILVPLSDTQQLAQEILSLISDNNLLRQYGHEAQKDVSLRFSSATIINKWIELLKEE